MKTRIRLFITLCLIASSILAYGQQKPSSHHLAAEGLLSAMDMKANFSIAMMASMSSMKEALGGASISANKQLELTNFFQKYLSWNSVKEGLIQLYMSEFSENELIDITNFYLTPSGRKWSSKSPVLYQKGINLAKSIVAEHYSELQKILNSKN